ncbi:hypothetical protein KC323_g139 [Hortaea werneckii]|nr:hypothetical protein KC323_g139 [Hortaea werneckii]
MDRDLTSLDICLAKHMSLRRLRSTTMRWIQPKNTTLISAYRKREGKRRVKRWRLPWFKGEIRMGKAS